MSTEALGSSFLKDVKEEGLDELLRSLRATTSPSDKPISGIPTLHRFIHAFSAPRELSHRHVAIPHESLPHQGLTDFYKSIVVELAGKTACSGKTQLLYYLIAVGILPASISINNDDDINFNGQEAAVVLLDLSGDFSVLRLHEIISYIIKTHIPRDEIEVAFDCERLIREAFQHLHVFHPHSSESLKTTVNSLESYLLAQPFSHLSASRRVAFIVINSLSSYFWQDRLDSEDAEVDREPPDKQEGGLFIQRWRDIVTALRQTQQILECPIVATNWALGSMYSERGKPMLKPHLPNVWNSFCTVRLVVERNKVKNFGPGLSAQEALSEKGLRQEVLDSREFSCWVNWCGYEDWRDEVREAASRLRGTAFSFKILGDGIAIDSLD